MFTGIVEAVGEVLSFEEGNALGTLVVRSDGLFAGLSEGASVAFNGACLTAVTLSADQVTVELVPETLERTNLGSLTRGSTVNLERAMPASGRFDGHIVQGHVDATVVLSEIDDLGESRKLWFSLDPSQAPFVIEKGSVTLNGVSLTVVDASESGFSVALIPHTLTTTNLGLLVIGDELNFEADVLAKYVERLLGTRA